MLELNFLSFEWFNLCCFSYSLYVAYYTLFRVLKFFLVIASIHIANNNKLPWFDTISWTNSYYFRLKGVSKGSLGISYQVISYEIACDFDAPLKPVKNPKRVTPSSKKCKCCDIVNIRRVVYKKLNFWQSWNNFQWKWLNLIDEMDFYHPLTKFPIMKTNVKLMINGKQSNFKDYVHHESMHTLNTKLTKEIS